MEFALRFKELKRHSLRPWRRGFITTTLLAASAFGAGHLWNAGSAEWAFVLAFAATWLLISLFWSNDHFIEETSLIFASCVDRNFEAVDERLQRIESELEGRREQPPARLNEAG